MLCKNGQTARNVLTLVTDSAENRSTDCSRSEGSRDQRTTGRSSDKQVWLLSSSYRARRISADGLVEPKLKTVEAASFRDNGNRIRLRSPR